MVSFVARARPEALPTADAAAGNAVSLRPVLIGLLIAAAIVGGVVSWFASTHPDGLEWSIAKVTGKEEVAGSEDGMHKELAAVQEKTAFLPDYGFKARPRSKQERWRAVAGGRRRNVRRGHRGRI